MPVLQSRASLTNFHKVNVNICAKKDKFESNSVLRQHVGNGENIKRVSNDQRHIDLCFTKSGVCDKPKLQPTHQSC